MSYRVEYGPEAIAYIDNQIEWLRGQAISDETIASWLRQLLHFTEGLYIAPYRHATAEAESERLGKDIRKTHVGDYLIFYSIDEEQRRVAVVRIRHAAQQVNVGR